MGDTIHTAEEKNFSNNVVWYNFILCVCVVFLHAGNQERFTEQAVVFGYPVFNEIETWMSNIISPNIVGGFFLGSGYLFYRNYSPDKMSAKYKSRLHSLLIPYVLWTLLYFFLHAAISRIPALAVVFQEEPIAVTWKSLLDAVINYRYCPFLWFLQFLIAYIAVSPLLYLLLKNRLSGGICFCVMLAAAETRVLGGQSGAMLNWLIPYMTGAWLGMYHKEEIEKKKLSQRTAVCSLLLLCLAYQVSRHVPSVLCSVGYSIAFAGALWCLLACEKRQGKTETMPVSGQWQKNTFAVYMTHFLIVQGTNTIVSTLVSASMWVGIILYFGLPAICFGMAALMKKICGDGTWRLWQALMGKR